MGFEPTASSMPSRRAPNCATAPPLLLFDFITRRQVRQQTDGSLAPHWSLSFPPKPCVSHREKERSIVARVVFAQARTRMVHVARLNNESLVSSPEDIDSHGCLRREVHPGCHARRDIVRAEENPSRNAHVRSDFLSAGEIPSPYHRLKASTVHRPLRRENRVHRQKFYCPFEISPAPTFPVIPAQNKSQAYADIQEVRVRRIGYVRSAPGDRAELPRTARHRLGWPTAAFQTRRRFVMCVLGRRRVLGRVLSPRDSSGDYDQHHDQNSFHIFTACMSCEWQTVKSGENLPGCGIRKPMAGPCSPSSSSK